MALSSSAQKCFIKFIQFILLSVVTIRLVCTLSAQWNRKKTYRRFYQALLELVPNGKPQRIMDYESHNECIGDLNPSTQSSSCYFHFRQSALWKINVGSGFLPIDKGDEGFSAVMEEIGGPLENSSHGWHLRQSRTMYKSAKQGIRTRVIKLTVQRRTTWPNQFVYNGFYNAIIVATIIHTNAWSSDCQLELTLSIQC